MRALLIVQPVENLFGAGIAQQVYFTRLTLRRCGLEVDVGAVGAPVPAYRAVGIETEALNAESDPSRWHMIMFISTGLTYEDPACRTFLDRAKAAGVSLIQLLCGNYFYLLQEQFVLKKHAPHQLRQSLFNPALDEYWALETYRDHRPFMEALLGLPVRIVPYCWNPDIVRIYCRLRGLRPEHENTSPGKGLRVLIAEPNVSIHKSVLVPLLIADGLHRALRLEYRNDFRVLVLSGGALDHELLAPFLKIYAERRVEIYPRIPLMQVLDELRVKGHDVLFVCHQINNGLNFLHLEAINFGYPVVHNSVQLRETGYFYAGEDIAAGVSAAQAAVSDSPAFTAVRRSRESTVLAQYDPEGDRVVAGYREVIASLMSKSEVSSIGV